MRTIALRNLVPGAVFTAALCFSVIVRVQADEAVLIEPLRTAAKKAAEGAEKIPDQRKALLDKGVPFILERAKAGKPVDLIFICTHNSRRSHLSQVWAQTASSYYGVPNVRTYSGGMEATACNIRTVRAMRRAGFSIAASNADKNPLYLIQYAEAESPIKAWSKVYTDAANPKRDYVAMMCCSDVDEKCPNVIGSALRIPLHYIDPKKADNTPAEAASYDATCREISEEMFYLMSQVAKKTQKGT